MFRRPMPKNSINIKELKDFFVNFAVNKHRDDLVEILKKRDLGTHYRIIVEGIILFSSSEQPANTKLDVNNLLFWLIKKPNEFLQIFDTALLKASKLICESYELEDSLILKPYIHARISGLPYIPEILRCKMPKIADYGRFVSISGTVIRTSQVKMLQFEKSYECKKCRFKNAFKAELELFYTMNSTMKCQNPITCDSAKFTPVGETETSQCKDYQEIRIQEQVQKLEIGNIPKAMSVILEDDLVDSCKPGDCVIINGTVMRRWGKLNQGSRPEIEIVVKANHVLINNDQTNDMNLTKEMNRQFEEFWGCHSRLRLTGRDKILASFCPQVYGLYIVKLAFALVLSGGVPKTKSAKTKSGKPDEGGTKVRGHSHLLLVGDPGTAKSQFLKYAAKMTPRSVMTTGIGSTSAGLTCAAVREGSMWHLQAGALVMADNGICCIDEFNSIKEHDRGSIHEAMEQQTISVAKAGLVCTLNTRCTILAATNPKGCYDCSASLSVNTAIASPLLSRFDVILVLLDSRNEDWDSLVSSYILYGNNPHINVASDAGILWNMDKMQAYFSYIKCINPKMTNDASLILKKYYQYQRRVDTENAGRTTVRLLESLIRLAQAHARLTCQNKVTVVDAVVAVSVMEASIQGAAVILGESILHTSFPNDAEADYLEKAKIILEKLELQEMLQRELESFGSNLDVQVSNETSRTSMSPDLFSHSSNSNSSEDPKLVSTPILQQNETNKEAETPKSTAEDHRTKDRPRFSLERFAYKGLSSKVHHKSDETVVDKDTKISRNIQGETSKDKESGVEVTRQCKRVRIESNNEKPVTDVETSLHGESNKKVALKLSAFAFGNAGTSKSGGGFSGAEDMVKYSQLAVEDLDLNLSSDDGF